MSKLLLLLALLVTPAAAQTTDSETEKTATKASETKESESKEKTLPLEPEKTLQFSTDRVTWMSLDVDPGGERLVIEVLGDLYLLPEEGGVAEPLLTGMAFDSQPAFSPDGTQIAFISDRDGAENVWLLDVSTREATQLTEGGKAYEYASPTWSPDGKQVLVSRTSWTQRTFELWAHPVDGGNGVRITRAMKNDQVPNNQRHNALGAVYDVSGRYLYYARKSGGFGYNLNLPLWQIARRDLRRGTEDVLTRAPGSAFRPILSPDGQMLVYGTRYQQQTGLRLRNLRTGEDRWLAYPIQRDDQESRFTRDLLPGYAFTPDGQSVVTTRGGALIRVEVASGDITEIPYRVDIQKAVAQRLEFPRRIGLGPVKSRVLGHPQLSPNGEKLAFSSFSRIYVYDFVKGSTDQVTGDDMTAAMPSWSPDGRFIAFAGWRDDEGGIFRARPREGARLKRVTQTSSYYTYPAWSPDGERIVALRGSPREQRLREGGYGQVVGADLVWLDAGGGESNLIIPSRGLGRPHFGPEADRIYLYLASSTSPSRAKSGLVSVRFDGTDRINHLLAEGPGRFNIGDKANPETMLMSPDGRHVLIQHANQVYLSQPLPFVRGQKVTLSKPETPLVRLTSVGADSIGWGADSDEIFWVTGDRAYRRTVASVDFDPETSAEEVEADDLLEGHEAVVETQIDVYQPRHKPEGLVALTNARLVRVGADEPFVEDGVVVIENDRIIASGPTEEVDVPDAARVIDLDGQYVLPGFVDTHAHFRIYRELYDASEYSFLANLAYGVTTGMDVQPSTIDLLAAKDRVDAGLLLGPRAFSTGPGVFSNNAFKSADHARAILSRYKERYRVHNIKAYISGSRVQRQYLIEAAHQLKLMPTTEGALDMKEGLTHAIDGFSGMEHNFPLPTLHDDVVQLAARTNIAYTPTLLVTYGGPHFEHFFYTRESPYEDAKLRRFTPYEFLARKSLRGRWFHEREFVTSEVAASAKKVLDAGGQVGVGSHGQLQGLGYHWELWALASGGLSNAQALKSATIMGARMLGIAQDIGSLDVGKLADLVVLRENPLEDIRATANLRYVMKGGELYEADTLDQIWPEQKPLPDQWWWNEGPEQRVP